MWVKICGIRDVATAQKIARLAPDAIGLNFYENTPRTVSVETAREIVSSLPGGIEPVGIFVNHSTDEIRQTCRDCRIRTLQLHGDEPAELLAEIRDAVADVKLIRALRIGSHGSLESTLGEYLEACQRIGVSLDACLVDARGDGLYGGTGKTVCWDLLSQEYRRKAWPPLILAGGLTAENVADAIGAVQPWGVDVASGVESAPGVKDVKQVKRFIEGARKANHG